MSPLRSNQLCYRPNTTPSSAFGILAELARRSPLARAIIISTLAALILNDLDVALMEKTIARERAVLTGKISDLAGIISAAHTELDEAGVPEAEGNPRRAIPLARRVRFLARRDWR